VQYNGLRQRTLKIAVSVIALDSRSILWREKLASKPDKLLETTLVETSQTCDQSAGGHTKVVMTIVVSFNGDWQAI